MILFKHCIVCNKKYFKRYNESKKNWKKRKFCSLKCWGIDYHSKPNPTKGRKNPKLSGENHWLFGKHHSKKSIQKMRKSLKGKIPWNKGLKGYKSGSDNCNWQGGISKNNAYIHIWKPNHPFKTKKGYVAEHRLVAEKCLNRYLTKLEVIHHINGIKTDNRPENLYLFSSIKEHTIYHRLKRKHILLSNIT